MPVEAIRHYWFRGCHTRYVNGVVACTLSSGKLAIFCEAGLHEDVDTPHSFVPPISLWTFLG